MKQLNKIIALIVAIVGVNSVQAQDENNPWTLSFGVNAVSTRPSAAPSGETFEKFSNYHSVDKLWNVIPSVSYLNVSKYIGKGFSAGVTGSVNKISKVVGYNAVTEKHHVFNPGNLLFYSLDLNGKYAFKELIGTKSFDPYAYLGGGLTWMGRSSAWSVNGGIGVNYWITEGFALTVQTGLRKQIDDHDQARSHFQHLFGLTFGLGMKDQDKDKIADKDDEDDKEGFLATCKNSGCLDDDIYNIFECYLNLPEIPDPAQNPLSFACIRKQQQQDEQLLALQVKYPDQYIYKSLDKDVEDIICHVHQGDSPNEQWHIALPQQMLEATIKWFHQVMGHPGEKCLCQMFQQCYYHSKLRYTIDKFRCEHCQ